MSQHIEKKKKNIQHFCLSHKHSLHFLNNLSIPPSLSSAASAERQEGQRKVNMARGRKGAEGSHWHVKNDDTDEESQVSHSAIKFLKSFYGCKNVLI